jgi:hypothetical protein
MGTTQTTATKGRPATGGMPEISEMPPTVIASEKKDFFLCFYFILHNCETCNHLNVLCCSPAVVNTVKRKKM